MTYSLPSVVLSTRENVRGREGIDRESRAASAAQERDRRGGKERDRRAVTAQLTYTF